MAPSFLTKKELTEIFTYLGEYYSYLRSKDYSDLSNEEKEILVRIKILIERN
jgi:hypothetical protein